jgi:hypothetical protein
LKSDNLCHIFQIWRKLSEKFTPILGFFLFYFLFI